MVSLTGWAGVIKQQKCQRPRIGHNQKTFLHFVFFTTAIKTLSNASFSFITTDQNTFQHSVFSIQQPKERLTVSKYLHSDRVISNYNFERDTLNDKQYKFFTMAAYPRDRGDVGIMPTRERERERPSMRPQDRSYLKGSRWYLFCSSQCGTKET